MSAPESNIEDVLPRIPVESLPEPATSPNTSLIGQGLLVVAMLAAIMTLMRALRKRARVSAVQHPGDPRERLDRIREHAINGRAPLDRVMSDAEELARHLAAILDNKAARLEALIEEADRKIGYLERRVTTLDDVPPVVRRTPGAGLNGNGGYGHNGVQGSAGLSTPGSGAEPGNMPTPSTGAGTAAEATLSVRERIYRMADAGRTGSEIARELGQPAGQVELLLALRRAGR